MASAPTLLTPAALRRLHPRSIDAPGRVLELLGEVQRRGVLLERAKNRESLVETARVLRVDGDGLLLTTENFQFEAGEQVFLNFELDGRPYFFATPHRATPAEGKLLLALPAVLYEAERRDRTRRPDPGHHVRLWHAEGELGEAEVVDRSADGLGLRVPDAWPLAPGSALRLELAGQPAHARVRNARAEADAPGWRRIGLSVSSRAPGDPLPVLRRDAILAPAPPQAPAAAAADRATRSGWLHNDELHVVDYWNGRSEKLRALLDGWGPAADAVAVLIPPSWGRTKETLLPLAATIVATFRQAGVPVTVLRYDGIRKRGESHNDPEIRSPGDEYRHFTFSQGVRDVHATLDFLYGDPELRPRTAILVTFSVASIEGRKAVATASPERLGGWVSVVGSADAQSLTRVISGGVDFFGGAEKGIRFGDQELQGLVVDMDLAGRDAIEHRMAFLEDSREDFSAIDVPVTWIHGRDDAWMDLERIREVMAFGDASQRRILEVPTGHQLRTSQEALEVFQLVAVEIGRMALGRELAPALPDFAWLAARRKAERARLQAARVDLQGFWRDYLVGREGELGMELVTSTRPYRDLMALQIEALGLRPGERVLDLGSGIGSFPAQLLESERPAGLRIVQADYVREALVRARDRVGREGIDYLACGLDLSGATARVPFADACCDVVLASLLLNYVNDPVALLRELYRILAPGGRLVLSSLKRDADTSTICVDTVAELQAGRGREVFGAEGERRMQGALGRFINDAARLLDFEEQGHFHFWSHDELRRLAERAGFESEGSQRAFGRVPQAILLTARRPER